MSRQQVHHLIERGIVERRGAQAYLMASAPPSWRVDVQIGLLSLGPEAVVSHEAAAKLHEFDRFRRDVLEFTVRRRRRGGEVIDATVHTSLILPDVDIVEIDGLRVTSPARTIIDLAGLHIKPLRVEAAIDSAIRLGSHRPGRTAPQAHGTARQGPTRRRAARDDAHHVRWALGARARVPQDRHTRGSLPMPQTQVVHERDGRVRRPCRLPVPGSWDRRRGVRRTRALDGRRSCQGRASTQRTSGAWDGLVLEFTYEDVMEREPYVVRTLRKGFMSRQSPVPATERDMKQVLGELLGAFPAQGELYQGDEAVFHVSSVSGVAPQHGDVVVDLDCFADRWDARGCVGRRRG